MAALDEIRDFKTDTTTGDMVISGGDIVGVAGLDSIRQDVESACAFIKGEYYLDLDVGVDYFGLIFEKGISEEVVRSEFTREIAARRGIISVNSVGVIIDSATRHASVDFQATADEGQLSGTTQVEVP